MPARNVNPYLRLFFVGTLFLLAAPVAVADYWYEHYARAESAIEAEDWSTAVQELNEALERKGDSGARVRSYGMRVTPYFPYLKLGIAYHHLGQFDAALQAFQTEEQLGAIQESDEDLAELERYRGLSLAGQQAVNEAEGEQVAEIVRDSLREAERLENEGRLQAAMEALGKALAVDPENPEAAARMEMLVEQERQRQQESRIADLMSRGVALLQAQDYAEASSLFQQVLSIGPNEETQRLLEQAQAGLLTEVEASEAGLAAIQSGLTAARDLEAAARFSEALDRLQPVLAVDPGNSEALDLQDRILLAQKEAARLEVVEQALAEADAETKAGRFEGAISAANRALAQDPGNASALEYVRSAYQVISRRLLGSGTVQNIPPAIRFQDLREDQDDGARVQLVQSPDFHLSGVIIDNTAVEIVYEGPAGREIEGRSTSQPVGEFFITEFSVDDELASGASTYRLVATDSAGLVSSAEYLVMYAPPFYRALWFQVSVGVIVTGLLAGMWALRLRRRRQLVRRRFNPYIAGAPVLDQKLFFGRNQLIERILQTIHNNSLMLHGERRIGKTSLQHYLKKRIAILEDPDYDFYPVYIDLQGTPEERFFATLAEDIFHDLAPVLEGLEADEELSAGSAYGYRELVADLRKVFKVLEARSSKRVKLVLLIDEVDELNDYDPRINQKLRSLFMKGFAENLVAVVSGVEIRKQWEKEGSPWYNFFEEIEITAIGSEDAQALITEPILGMFKFDQGVVDRIIEITDCKPYLIQKYCIALVNRLHEQSRRTITIADVDAIAASKES